MKPFSLDLATMFCEQNCMHAEALPCWLSGDSVGAGEEKERAPGP